MKLIEILDRIKNENGINSNGELARFLGTDVRRVGEYYAGKRSPIDEDYPRIAEKVGITAGELWELVQIEKKKGNEAARAWENYMKRLGGMAASFALVFLCLVTFIMTPTPANANEINHLPYFSQARLCIMLSRRREKLFSQVKAILSRIGQKVSFCVIIERIAKKPT